MFSGYGGQDPIMSAMYSMGYGGGMPYSNQQGGQQQPSGGQYGQPFAPTVSYGYVGSGGGQQSSGSSGDLTSSLASILKGLPTQGTTTFTNTYNQAPITPTFNFTTPSYNGGSTTRPASQPAYTSPSQAVKPPQPAPSPAPAPSNAWATSQGINANLGGYSGITYTPAVGTGGIPGLTSTPATGNNIFNPFYNPNLVWH